MIFAGVELEDIQQLNTGLEYKRINLVKYACYNHIGPYHQIKHVGQHMKEELFAKGFTTCLPYIEKYGHWTEDVSKLETKLFMSLH